MNRPSFFLLAAACTLLQAGPLLAQQVVFEDLMGETVTLGGPAESIVTIVIPSAIDVIAVDQSVDRLSGVNPNFVNSLPRSIIGQLLPEALSLNTNIIGAGGIFVPNVEAIAALAPDVVIQWGDRGADLVAPLTNAGITVAGYRVGSEEATRAGITMIGAMTGNAERAEALNAWRETTWQAVATAAAAIPEQDRLSVVAFSVADDAFSVTGANSSNDVSIRLAGAHNAAAEIPGMATVSAEQIAAWNPDVIFVYSRDEIDSIVNHPILSLTNAALENRVYLLPTASTNWSSQGMDNPLFWMWIGMVLYPEHHSYDLGGEITRWMDFMYGHTLMAEQIDAILETGVNAASRNYDVVSR